MTERAIVDVGTRDRPGRSFDVVNPYLAGWLDEQTLELAGNVPATTTQKLQETLSEGIRAGEGMPALQQRVAGVYGEARGSRAELIARTEANKAANGASWAQAKGSGVVKTKTWLATKDSRTRPEHLAMNGETVPLDEPFSNGEMFPSAPRCRCTLTYGIDESALREDVAQEAPGGFRPDMSNKEMDAWARENFGVKAADLTADQLEALRAYQGAGYQRINPFLRGKIKPSDTSTLKGRIKHIDDVMKRSEVPEDVTVLRAMGQSAFGDTPLEDLVGKVFQDKGYMSTALKNKPPADFAQKRVIMNLKVPRGTRGVYMSDIAKERRFKAEQELLLDRGLKFKVTDARYNSRSGKWVVDAEIVG